MSEENTAVETPPEQENQPLAHRPPKRYKPKNIRSTDHAKFYIIKNRGQVPYHLAQDKHENRRLWQQTAARLRGLGENYIDELEKANAIGELSTANLKQLSAYFEQVQKMDKAAYEETTTLPPRKGSSNPDSFDDLLADAVGAGMKIKEKEQNNQKKNQAIPVEATDVE